MGAVRDPAQSIHGVAVVGYRSHPLLLRDGAFAQAFDLANGLMYAVPAPSEPALDGTDKGWDLSAAEPIWMSTQLAAQLQSPYRRQGRLPASIPKETHRPTPQ